MVGFHGQTPGNIVLINPDTAGSCGGPVYKCLQKWLRVIVEKQRQRQDHSEATITNNWTLSCSLSTA